MAACYTLKIVTDFASAHTLREYPGACARMHGHNWKVETEVRASSLDKMGMGVDFKVIKQATRDIAAKLDHRYLNDLEPFTDINPTAENIAAYFYQELSAQLNNESIRVHAVTLWETERACVRYAEDES
ncbi:6-pyruvoyltetrahydropterin/6-carboxytetrahydropterin synthase [Thiogranum longum]|uniref:6-carboxy-5,6,7,8-tetrahydropterin synthase n=1 Tax=Thiogranum longum TaxID=1537524 RepID=A0A4R1H6R3_9GAMM|nr:6-carboxytetrahydropterin synthase QueD [Thiogranum longum]TCK17444.1 6-pyruvoyltetrahydropterin/6-carboxytetrahydropterin synthase [Thiogranum longum]